MQSPKQLQKIGVRNKDNKPIVYFVFFWGFFFLGFPHSWVIAQDDNNANKPPPHWGQRIGLDPNAIVTADFIDTDKDGTDDRYQKGPKQRPNPQPEPMLPLIEYLGGEPSQGIQDIRIGVELYGEWFNHNENTKKGQPNTPSKLEKVDHEGLAENPKLKQKGIRFSFPNGVQIFLSKDAQIVLVNNKGTYNAYKYTDKENNQFQNYNSGTKDPTSLNPKLTKLDYFGKMEKDEAKDGLLGKDIYTEWLKLKGGDPSQLSPYKHKIFPEHTIFKKLISGDVPTVKIEFENGVNIYYSKNINYIVLETPTPYEEGGVQMQAFSLKK
jgi:hypothetical protein